MMIGENASIGRYEKSRRKLINQELRTISGESTKPGVTSEIDYDGGSGDDLILSYGSGKQVLKGGDGDDYIEVGPQSSDVTIDGDDGADFITYAVQPLTTIMLAGWIVGDLLMFAIAGAIIGAIYKPGPITSGANV